MDISAVLAVLGDPDAESAYRAVIALEARRDGYRTGYAAGWIAAFKAVKRAQHQAVTDLETECERWLVLCGPCRRNGRRERCDRCEHRTRETFGQPHPDDYQGGAL